MFNFLRLLPIGDTTKCRNPKNGKNWGFSSTEGDRINRSRRNLAHKRIPWVCYSTVHLALIGKRGRYMSPKMSKFAKNCGFWPPEADTMNTFRRNLAYKCRPYVCSSTPSLTLIGKRGSVRELSKVKIGPKLWLLATGGRYSARIHMKFGV